MHFTKTGEQVNKFFARFQIGELGLKARPQCVDRELHLGIRADREQPYEISRMLLRKHARSQNLGMQFRAKRLIRLFRLEGRALAVFDERFEDRLRVVGEIHHHNPILPLVAAVQA